MIQKKIIDKCLFFSKKKLLLKTLSSYLNQFL